MKKIVLLCAFIMTFCCGCGGETKYESGNRNPGNGLTEIPKEEVSDETQKQETDSSDKTGEVSGQQLTPALNPNIKEEVLPTPAPLDTEPPVISGLQNIMIKVGETVSYRKGVTVTDNVDEEVSLEIDASEVDLHVSGTYYVYYTATDSAGNVTEQSIEIAVKEPDDKETLVNEMIDELIAELITEDMSKWDTCYTLWNWCRTQIKYTSNPGDMSSIYTGAYEGLHDRRGDCYAYYATFSLLLDECGIENMAVHRTGGTTDHVWNLVNLGDGWYHCDSSPRKKGHTYKCFMQTDAQIQEYTEFYKEKKNYYGFDKSLYPERGTEIIFDGDIDKE